MKRLVMLVAPLLAVIACMDTPDMASSSPEESTESTTSPLEVQESPASSPALLEDICTTGVPVCAGKPVNSACKIGSSPEGWCYVQFQPNDVPYCNCGNGQDA